MGYYIILYNILLLFGGLFISGGLRPLPKWPIALAGPASSFEIRQQAHSRCFVVSPKTLRLLKSKPAQPMHVLRSLGTMVIFLGLI